MKAGIFYGTGKVGVEEIAKPIPGPNDVVVKVLLNIPALFEPPFRDLRATIPVEQSR